ncbi:LON peptidase substrate-binding domain-containing protein [Aquabacterium sp. J223]|uniref:LON peptidase substrate-binding domain-containing protein n=1 Tax=Aquabacterium sp. J223 TaxID=2898431 RepID=UPI0021ADD513|nr:LON peptidase substrate-binding domain-containing protein [Aquabacterium sp. J223]UUX96586.1 LON peptidase substrate-binding domain-containing protein [Aquabacterium sp. J223]
MTPDVPDDAPSLPLFPLRSVLFPGGLLPLKVFEARYLDLIGRCLRGQEPFGVVCLRQGTEVQLPGRPPARFEAVGVLAEILEVDSEQAGILKVQCRGGQRFRIGAPTQAADGLWQAPHRRLPADATLAPPPEHLPTVKALAQAIASLKGQGAAPFLEPYRFDDAGWVANRWCELLPIPMSARQQLMALDEPLVRLRLVDEFLRSKGVLSDPEP